MCPMCWMMMKMTGFKVVVDVVDRLKGGYSAKDWMRMCLSLDWLGLWVTACLRLT